MLAIALGVLVVTAGITASLARRTATNSARSELQQKAPEVAAALSDVFSGADKLTLQQLRDRLAGTGLAPRVKKLIETTLTVSDGAVIALDANGDQQEILGKLFGTESSLLKLPPGVSPGDLDTQALLAGETQTGRDGNTVFVATPLAQVRGLTPVVVLAKDVETRPFGQSSGVVLLAALGAIVVAAVVAAFLARRITRPIAAMETTAGRIASGDFSARVDLTDVPHDELGELADAINTMGEELQNARGHERAFLLSVSHDLRTPLTSIRGYSQAIADGTVSDRDEQLHAAEVISAEARRLQRLVADLLDLARLDAHQFSLAPRPDRRARSRRRDRRRVPAPGRRHRPHHRVRRRRRGADERRSRAARADRRQSRRERVEVRDVVGDRRPHPVGRRGPDHRRRRRPGDQPRGPAARVRAALRLTHGARPRGRHRDRTRHRARARRRDGRRRPRGADRQRRHPLRRDPAGNLAEPDPSMGGDS